MGLTRINPTALFLSPIFLSAIYVTINAVQFRKLRRWVPIFGFLEQRQYCFEIDIGCLRHVLCLNKQEIGWCALVEHYHGMHTGRGNVGLCLCTSLMYDVYGCIEYTEMLK